MSFPNEFDDVPAMVESVSDYQTCCQVARKLVSASDWGVGELAHRVEEEFGHTVRQFSNQINEDYDRVYRCKVTWETFRDHPLRTSSRLSFTHFRYAKPWADANEVLAWAAEQGASVSEMRAYRSQVLHPGEPSEEDDHELPEGNLPLAPWHIVHDPSQLARPNDTAEDGAEPAMLERPKEKPADSGGAQAAQGDQPQASDDPAGPPTSIRSAVEDHLNSLSVTDLCEAIRAVDGTDKDKAAALRALADELDPPKGLTKTKAPEATDEEFEQFWHLYPRRVGKGHARKAFQKAYKAIGLVRILEATDDFARNCAETNKDAQYIPHPATWLNGERWDDDLDSPVSGDGRTQQTVGGLADWLRESNGGTVQRDAGQTTAERGLACLE
jgi:hypothetical protein